MKKKILIFGGTGTLGSNFVIKLKDNYNLFLNFHKTKFFVDKIKYLKIIDNKIDENKIKESILKIKPNIIINFAAETNIDFCEKNPKISNKINLILPKVLSKICKEFNIKFIHISTDQFYKIRKKFKTERDKTSNLNIYSKHKLAAEKIILKSNKKNVVIRTNFFGHSLYEEKSLNQFIKKIKQRKKLYLFNDYYFTPIYSFILIDIIKKIIIKNISGLFNIVGNNRLSKYEFARKIADIINIKNPNFELSKLKDGKLFAKRNNDLSLSNNKIKKVLNIKIPNIDQQLKDFFKNDKNLKRKELIQIPYGKHSINNKDINFVKNILTSKNLTQGDFVKETEAKIANYVGSKYAVAVSSATAGLHLSYLALGVNNKKKIVTSPITFLSTSNAALYCNSKPYFSDIDIKNLNISPSKLEDLIKKNKDIFCLAPVHFGGLSKNMNEINYLKKKYNLKIVEDAAHALGAKYECGSMVGSCKYSDLCVFSFHPVKIIAGGEGGIITTNSDALYKKLISLRTHGVLQESIKFKNKLIAFTNKTKNNWYYEMDNLGYHYRQTDIHSALIYSQMNRIEDFLNKRRKICEYYDNYFSNINYLNLYQQQFRNYSSNHLYIINLKFNRKFSRNYLMNELNKRNIFTQVHYIPVPLQWYYKKLGYNMKGLDNALEYYKNCLSLPIYYDLKTKHQKYVIECLEEIVTS